MAFNLDFYKNKKVLITGHTGFKGTWLCKMLLIAGANVAGYALDPLTNPNLFELSGISSQVDYIKGDIRDLEKLKKFFDKVQPEIVIHMAAQPLVIDGYKKPVYTYETNVMGTINVLECIRNNNSVRSFVNVTTDKVYLNKEWHWGYRENDELDGYDPYSNSKSCSELITHSYQKSFFTTNKGEIIIPISTARAGNVIGGGDFSPNRIVPDCIKSAIRHEDIVLRNPYSTRPYQHVLEPLYAYLMIAAEQYDNPQINGCYNIGPDDTDCYQTKALVDLFIKYWGCNVKWREKNISNNLHEANFLKLDCSKIKNTFGWKPHWHLETAMEKTVEWTKCWLTGENINKIMDKQISQFIEI